MYYKATEKYQRTSPRKLRLIADEIKKFSPKEALEYLAIVPKKAGLPIYKALFSAVSNAKDKDINIEDLILKSINIGIGPSMKRWRAVSRGRAHGYKKRMSHINIILEEKPKLKISKKQISTGGKK